MHWKTNKLFGVILFCAGTVFPVPAFCAEKTTDALLEKARSGDVQSQFLLGNEFFFGQNKRKVNMVLGVYYFRKAAAQNHAQAAYNLSIAYEYGWGCEKSLYESYVLCEKAWKLGLCEAGLRLTGKLRTGVPPERKGSHTTPEISKNSVRAFEVFRELLKRDYLPAWREFSILLLENPKMNVPERGAIRSMLEHAAENGSDMTAAYYLAIVYRDGINGPADEKKAIALLKKAAERGQPDALYELAVAYESGAGVEFLPDHAKKLILLAVERGSAKAKVRLGNYYLQGIVLKADEAKALSLFHEAAKAKCPAAFGCLGDCYFYGYGINADPKRGVDFYRDGAKMGDPHSQFRYAVCYQKGEGLPKDETAAVYWFRQSAALRNVQSMRELGLAMIEGRGIQKNVEDGKKLVQNAAALGDRRASALVHNQSW